MANVRHEDMGIPFRATAAGQLVMILNIFFYSGKDYQRPSFSLSNSSGMLQKERKTRTYFLN